MAKHMGTGLDMTGQKITSLADGSNAADAATWGQVQAYIRGLKYKWVRARATTNLTLSGTQTVDGVVLDAGDRVLADAQTTATEDGVYVVAAGAWARADDFAVGFDARGVAVTVTEGSTHADKLFVQTAEPAVVGTNGMVFGPLGGGATYTADGQGIELSGSTFSLELDGTTLAKGAAGLRIGPGAAGAGLTEASGVLAVGGGTGVTVGSDTVGIDTGVVARWFSNGGTHSAGTTVTLTHNLGRKSYVVSVSIAATGEEVMADVVKGDNSVTVTFGASQGSNTILLTVAG